MKSSIGLGVAAVLALGPALAHAQEGGNFDRSRNVGVLERPHPEYDALGVRAGSFMLFPELDTTLSHDDNVFALASGQVSDTFVTITPKATLSSDWSINALSANVYATRSNYFSKSSENHTDYGASLNGRLDIERGDFLTAATSYDRLSEPRSSIAATQFLAKPDIYTATDYSVGGQEEFNRLRLTGSYKRSDYRYQNAVATSGATISQAYRNRDEDLVSARADYAMTPDTSFYLTASHNSVAYSLKSPAIPNRNSNGYNVAVGADFDLSNLARGHLDVGYLNQSFKNKLLFPALKGVSVSGNIEYFPSTITTITLNASRNFQSTGLANSAGYSSTVTGIELDHELYRNIILNGRFSYESDEFRGIDRKDGRYNTTLGGTYLLNRSVGVTASYSYFTQNSSGAQRGVEFKDNRFDLKLALKY